MKIKCPYCKKDITTNNTFSGGMVFCDFCNHNFFLQIKRSAFPHYLLYTILFVACILLGYNCIKMNQRYNVFFTDEKIKEDIWGAEKEQLEKRIESIASEKKEELDKLNKIIAAHETTIQQQTVKETLDNSNYQKTIDDLESTRDKLLEENKNLLSENEQLIKQLGNAKQEKSNTSIQPKVNSKTTVPAPPTKTLDALPGVVYDFRRSANGSISSIGSLPKGTNQTLAVDSLLPIYKKFVLGKWIQGVNTVSSSYKDIEQYYCYPLRLYKSNIYVSPTSSSTVIRSFDDNNASVSGWVAIHSGYVVAPFTGNFRFVGCGDDALVIRFNQKLVFDYGYYSLSLGKRISGPADCNEIATTNQGRRLLPEKGLYTDKLEVYYPNVFGEHGVAKGLPISVKRGSVYPIEILYADVEGGQFALALFVEQLDSNGNPLKQNPEKLPLFRTTSELPKHMGSSDFPDFDDDSPIWKVVDSQGKPIPLRTDVAADQQKSDPNPKKTVSTTKQGNVTTSKGISTTKTTSGNKPESSPSKTIQTPFGSTQRPVEDEE